jgi:hypothetical protein
MILFACGLLTQGDTPWNPSSFSDQVEDKFYQQVIDNEQSNSLNTDSDHSSGIKVDLVEQDIPKLSYFDPSDAHDTNVKGKYTNLVFHLDTVVMKNANDLPMKSYRYNNQLWINI